MEKNVKYVAFLDSDDVWCTNFYDDELRGEIVRDAKGAYKFNWYTGNQELTRVKFQQEAGGHFCSLFYGADILKNKVVRFPNGVKINEDHAFVHLFFIFCKSCGYFNKSIFIYRSNDNSTSHKKRDTDDLYFNNAIMAWEYAKDRAIKLGSEQVAQQCIIMEKTYVAEYIEVDCQKGDSIKEIKRHLDESKFTSLYDNDDVWVDDGSKRKWNEFSEHPRKFWIKARAKGIAISFAMKFRNFKFVQKRRYPIDLAGSGICSSVKK